MACSGPAVESVSLESYSVEQTLSDTMFLQNAEILSTHTGPDEPDWPRDASVLANVSTDDVPRCFLWRAAWSNGIGLLFGPRASYNERCNTSMVFIQGTTQIQWLLHMRLGDSITSALEAEPAVWPRVPASLTVTQLLSSFSAPSPALTRAAQSALSHIPQGETTPCFTRLPTDDVAANEARISLINKSAFVTVMASHGDRVELLADLPLGSDMTLMDLLAGSTVVSYPDLLFVLRGASDPAPDLSLAASCACARTAQTLSRVVKTLPFINDFAWRSTEAEKGAPSHLPPSRRATFNHETPSFTESIIKGAKMLAERALERASLADETSVRELCDQVISLCTANIFSIQTLCSLLSKLPAQCDVSSLCDVIARQARPAICYLILSALMGPHTEHRPAILRSFFRSLSISDLSPLIAVRMGCAAGCALIASTETSNNSYSGILSTLFEEFIDKEIELLEQHAITAEERTGDCAELPQARTPSAQLIAYLSLALTLCSDSLGLNVFKWDKKTDPEDSELSSCLSTLFSVKSKTVRSPPDLSLTLTHAVRILHAALCSSTRDVRELYRTPECQGEALHSAGSQLAAGALASRLVLLLSVLHDELSIFTQTATSPADFILFALSKGSWSHKACKVFEDTFSLGSCLKRLSSALELGLFLFQCIDKPNQRNVPSQKAANEPSSDDDTASELIYLEDNAVIGELAGSARTAAFALLLLAGQRSQSPVGAQDTNKETLTRGLELFYSIRRLSQACGHYTGYSAQVQSDFLRRALAGQFPPSTSAWPIIWSESVTGASLYATVTAFIQAIVQLGDRADHSDLLFSLMGTLFPAQDSQMQRPHGPVAVELISALAAVLSVNPDLITHDSFSDVASQQVLADLTLMTAQTIVPAPKNSTLPIRLPHYLPELTYYAALAHVLLSYSSDSAPALPEEATAQFITAHEELRKMLFDTNYEHYISDFSFQDTTLRTQLFAAARVLLTVCPSLLRPMIEHLDSSLAGTRSSLPANFQLSSIQPCLDALNASGVAGLENMGCVCYMNSVIQLLESVTPLRSALLRWNPPQDVAQTPAKRRLNPQQCCSFAETLRQFLLRLSTQPCTLDPHPIHTYWPQANFDVFDQHDAYEAYQVILDALEVAFAGSPLACTLDALFGIGMDAFFEPMEETSCTHVPSQTEKHVALRAQLCQENGKKVKTLEEGIQLGMAPAVYESYKCRECEARCTRQRRVVISRLPPFLVVNMERFKSDLMGYTSKVGHTVECPAVLDLAEFTDKPNVPARYRLVGAVVHAGTVDFGHYWYYGSRPRPGVDQYSDIGLEARIWIQYNDAHVSTVPPHAVRRAINGFHQGPTGFLLLYQSMDEWPQLEGTPEQLLAAAAEECGTVTMNKIESDSCLRQVQAALTHFPMELAAQYAEEASRLRALVPYFDSSVCQYYYTLLVATSHYESPLIGPALHLFFRYLSGNEATPPVSSFESRILLGSEMNDIVRSIATQPSPALVVAGPDSPLFMSESEFNEILNILQQASTSRSVWSGDRIVDDVCSHSPFLRLLLQETTYENMLLIFYSSSLRAQVGTEIDWVPVLRPFVVLMLLKRTRAFMECFEKLKGLLLGANDYVSLDAAALGQLT